MKNKETLVKVQVKFNQAVKRFTEPFTIPKQRFIRDMMFGILKSGDVKLNSISRSLQEEVSLKKTSERLGYHLLVLAFDKDLNKRLSYFYRRDLSSDSYLILDLSDLSKPNAEKMEGLSLVRDGSKSKPGEPSLTKGYYLCNVIGRKASSDVIYPLYSELYSLEKEGKSENSKILDAISTVSLSIKKGIWVLDRGGDRDCLIAPFLISNQSFIIRQQGNRHLRYKGKILPFIEVAKQVKLQYRFKSKTSDIAFKAGATRVSYKNFDKSLWLVVARFSEGGYFYFLCHLPDVFNPEIAAQKALEGYQMRWSIEEVHRHMKEDFLLEDVRLMTYQSLKTLLPLLWFALSFIYVKLKPISLEIIAKVPFKVLLKDKLSEWKGFVYYKLVKIIKFILHGITINKTEPFKNLELVNNQQVLKL